MPFLTKPFSARLWRSVLLWTILGTLACVVVAVAYNVVAFRDLGLDAQRQALVSAVVLPVLLGVPFFSYMSVRLHRLSITNTRLGVVATTDRLTGCLNRGAFTDRVNGYLEQAEFGTVPQCGALLVIDADHFKTINDRFGHDHGDEALMIIARTIRGMLRIGDTVGRLGGEEFGVFLPGVDTVTAEITAEKIRRAVNTAVFVPRGELRQLSVSIGGALFDRPTEFSELFRSADRSLYEAKSFGRNRAEINPMHVVSALQRGAA